MRHRRGFIRMKRLFVALLVMSASAGGAYLASWINSRAFFLVVGPVDVRVEKGRMLPLGREAFLPEDPTVRRAYVSFPLPSGAKIPRGETRFSDRVELDQALFRLLKDCLSFALEKDDKNTAPLVQRYLDQLRALPGTSLAQQLEFAQLERDAAFVNARARVESAQALLKEASQMFRASARGPGARGGDGDLRARQVEAAMQLLLSPATPRPVSETRAIEGLLNVETSSTSTMVHRGG